MKWRKESEYLAISDAGYKVAKFLTDGLSSYRASFQGQFIGQVTSDPKSAQKICENHWQITGQFDAAEAEQKDDEK